MRAWTSERGLLYEPLGLLPPASDFLHRGLGTKGETHHAPVHRLGRAGDWLVVLHDLGTGARTLAGIDALRADSVRLAGVG